MAAARVSAIDPESLLKQVQEGLLELADIVKRPEANPRRIKERANQLLEILHDDVLSSYFSDNPEHLITFMRSSIQLRKYLSVEVEPIKKAAIAYFTGELA